MTDTVCIEAHQAWLRLRGLRPATIIQRGYALRRLQVALRALYGVGLLEASHDQLRGWQSELTLTPVSLSVETSHVASFYTWAHDEGLIEVNPAAKLVRPKKPARLPRPMGEEPLAAAIATAPPDIRLILIIAAYCGLRAGEIARLQRSDVQDTARPPVVFVDGKGGTERGVPLSERVIMELYAYHPHSRGPLFPRRDGRPGGMTPQRLSHVVNCYLHGRGIPDTLHSCRHRFGTRVYAGTPDLRVLQALMGHTDPKTTAGYVQYSSARAVEAVELLGNARRTPADAPHAT